MSWFVVGVVKREGSPCLLFSCRCHGLGTPWQWLILCADDASTRASTDQKIRKSENQKIIIINVYCSRSTCSFLMLFRSFITQFFSGFSLLHNISAPFIVVFPDLTSSVNIFFLTPGNPITIPCPSPPSIHPAIHQPSSSNTTNGSIIRFKELL